MGTLIFGFVLLIVGLVVRASAKTLGSSGSKGAGMLVSLVSVVLMIIGAFTLISSSVKVIDAGTVGVQHAFGKVAPAPLLPGVRFVPPWSEVERYSTREEQFPQASEQAEQMDALSSEQMGMKVDAAVRWQIDPIQAPRIFTEIGGEEQIHAVVLNAIRNGVRDGMSKFTINDINQRSRVADVMKDEVDSALIKIGRAHV